MDETGKNRLNRQGVGAGRGWLGRLAAGCGHGGGWREGDQSALLCRPSVKEEGRGGALLVSLRDTSFGDMSPGWGTTTKDAPWAVRLAPRLRSGAKSLSQGSVSSEISQPPPLGRLPPADASKAARRGSQR